LRNVDVRCDVVGDGWTCEVTVADAATTTHRVRVSAGEHRRYGGGDVTDLVRRSFDFLLTREANTSILREFSLAEIEHYFPEFVNLPRRR
jgi:hypothetical protein